METTATPVLSDDVCRVLLAGWGAPGWRQTEDAVRLFRAGHTAWAAAWREHEIELRAAAVRLQIRPNRHGEFFAEAIAERCRQ